MHTPTQSLKTCDIKKIPYDKIHRETPQSYLYVIPVYNESEEELNLSLNSLSNQRITPGDIYSFCIICDGQVIGKGNNLSTDNILKNILKIYNNPKIFSYVTADSKTNHLELYTGFYKNIPYIFVVKLKNYGKRDSLVFVRRLAYLYNENIFSHQLLSSEIILFFNSYFDEIYMGKIKYIIGIDGDTQFEYNCTYELIKQI